MKFAKKAIAIMALGLAQVSAYAVPAVVTDWTYSVATQWSTTLGDTIFTGGTANTVVSPTEISWGANLSGPGFGTLAVGVERSGITVDVSSQNGTVTTNDPTPKITSVLSHTNNPLDASYATLKKATLQTTLMLTPLLPTAGPTLPSLSKTFAIDFSETPNTSGTCVVNSATVCDDIFVISLGSLNQSFFYDTFEYFVSIVKLSGPLSPLPSTTCAVAGAPSPCLGVITGEEAKTSFDFGLLITQAPVQIEVPEPGILSLMGLSMLGLVISRRRRKV